jgi:hypothetical protein
MPNAPFLAPERDSAFKRGRGKFSGAAQYVVPGVGFTSVGTDNLFSGSDYYAPFFVETPIVIDVMAIEITTLEALKSVRIGVLAADTDWQPYGAPLADSGSLSAASTGVKTYTPGTPIYLPRGRYLSAACSDSAATVQARYARGFGCMGGLIKPAMGTSGNVLYLNATRAYAAFQTPPTAWTAVGSTSATGMEHFVFYQVSTP